MVIVRSLRFNEVPTGGFRSPMSDYKSVSLVNRDFRIMVQPLLFERFTIGLNPNSNDHPSTDIKRLWEIMEHMKVFPAWRSWPKQVGVNSGGMSELRAELSDEDLARLETLVPCILLLLKDVQELHISNIRLTEGIQRHIHGFKRLRKLHIDLAWATPVDLQFPEGQLNALQDVRIETIICPTRLPFGVAVFALGPALKTLSLGSDVAETIYHHALSLDSSHFSNLKRLCVPIPISHLGTQGFTSLITKCVNLTRLEFKRATFRHRREKPTYPLPNSVLPNLQAYIGPIDIAMELMQGRPVQHIHVFDTSNSFRALSLPELALLMTSPCLKSLRIHDIVWTDPIISSIAALSPRLESLALHFEDGFAQYVVRVIGSV